VSGDSSDCVYGILVYVALALAFLFLAGVIAGVLLKVFGLGEAFIGRFIGHGETKFKRVRNVGECADSSSHVPMMPAMQSMTIPAYHDL
jgi:hypothetical protein